MSTPDGRPLMWILRWRGHEGVTQVCGPELLPKYIDHSQRRGSRHFFYGGSAGVADRLAKNLAERFPAAQIAGTLAPPFASVEELCDQRTVDEINATHADVVWVGLSTPKQDLWMARMRPVLEAPVLIGVGAAFDFTAGTLRRAPRWMTVLGVEWVYRLYREPRRLWRRYLRTNPAFVWALVRERFSGTSRAKQ
jgi:N-acetylglucosaminyldiphosphoundecaprenol N-acetyl-beta-D-mannosaminyltransferase